MLLLDEATINNSIQFSAATRTVCCLHAAQRLRVRGRDAPLLTSSSAAESERERLGLQASLLYSAAGVDVILCLFSAVKPPLRVAPSEQFLLLFW